MSGSLFETQCKLITMSISNADCPLILLMHHSDITTYIIGLSIKQQLAKKTTKPYV